MPRAKRTSIEGSKEENGASGGIAVLIVLILIGAVIVSLLSGTPQKPQNSIDLVDRSIEQVGRITKESFTFEGGLEAEVKDMYQGVGFSGSGQIDATNKRMHFDLSLDSDTFIDGGIDLQTYTIDDTIYIYFQNQWIKESVPGINWDNSLMSQKLMQFVDRFETGQMKAENVGGKDAYRIDIRPTMGEIFMLMQSINPSALEGLGITSASGLGQGIKNIEVTVWVDVQTLLPVKMDLLMDAQTASIDQETGVGVQTSDMIISATVNFNYSEDINIVLPTSAQSAV
jgi:hypothetical protein